MDGDTAKVIGGTLSTRDIVVAVTDNGQGPIGRVTEIVVADLIVEHIKKHTRAKITIQRSGKYNQPCQQCNYRHTRIDTKTLFLEKQSKESIYHNIQDSIMTDLPHSPRIEHRPNPLAYALDNSSKNSLSDNSIFRDSLSDNSIFRESPRASNSPSARPISAAEVRVVEHLKQHLSYKLAVICAALAGLCFVLFGVLAAVGKGPFKREERTISIVLLVIGCTVAPMLAGYSAMTIANKFAR